jgi:hypothetical protein
MGDAYSKTILVEQILDDTACKIIEKAAMKQSEQLKLSCLKLSHIPLAAFTQFSNNLQCIMDVDLSKNNLFDGEMLFQVFAIYRYMECFCSAKFILYMCYILGDWKFKCFVVFKLI